METIAGGDFRIAPGHNNIDNLARIDSIIVSGVRMWTVREFGQYRDGLEFVDGDGDVFGQGFPSFNAISGDLTFPQWTYWFNYLGGKRSGNVTVRFMRYYSPQVRGGDYFYVIANAKMVLSQPPNTTQNDNDYTPYAYQFTRVQIIEEDIMSGSIKVHGGAVAQTAITTTSVPLEGWDTDGISSGVTVDYVAGNITILSSGDYRFTANLAFLGDASTYYEFRLYKNAVDIVEGTQTTLNATPDDGNVSFSADVTCLVNDVFKIYVESDNGAGATLTLVDADFSIARLRLA